MIVYPVQAERWYVAGAMVERLTTTEAAGLLTWHLVHGEAITDEQAGALIGLGAHGAYQMLSRLSRVVPIYRDECGLWQVAATMELL